ncbi:MAG: DMT family transporter [Pseudomonadota bacterium]
MPTSPDTLVNPHLPWKRRWSALSDESRGWVWGLLGVLMFAVTLPMTRLAVGTAEAPQWSPLFVMAGRAAVAAALSAAYLLAVRAAWPPRHLIAHLLACGVGTVLGFPGCLAIALRHVDASHAAVITGVLPLATAVLAVGLTRRRAGRGFWLCALVGAGLVLAYAVHSASGAPGWADGLLLLAVLFAAGGYVAGAKASAELPAAQVTCWVLVLAMPVTLPWAWLTWPAQPAAIAPSAWVGLAYVSLFSMWLGFFAWYHGLALGGAARVSQVQLLQPFFSLLAAVPLLQESLDGAAVGCALAVGAVVWVARRMPAPAPEALWVASVSAGLPPIAGAALPAEPEPERPPHSPCHP